jgi:hypothetical protein
VSDWPGGKKATLKGGKSERLRERRREAEVRFPHDLTSIKFVLEKISYALPI